MQTTMISLCLLLTMPLALAPAVAAQSAEPDCAVVAATEGTYEFTMCGEGVNFQGVKNPDGAVQFSITTDQGSVACDWWAWQGVQCDGPMPRGTPGTVATLWLQPWGSYPVVGDHALFVVQTFSTR